MQVHFSSNASTRPKKLEDMELAAGEWVIKPYWSTDREPFEPRVPETPTLEDEYGETEKPQFFLEMLSKGYRVPWVYQRFG